MIGQMKVLLKVKTLKEEQALRALQAKRREVEGGQAAVVRAEEVVARSAATLGSREDALYAGILGRVVDRDAIEDTRGAAVALEQGHARLTDSLTAAQHGLARLENEAATASSVHRAADKVKGKYTVLTDDLLQRRAEAVEAAEENEVEELFGVRRQGLA